MRTSSLCRERLSSHNGAICHPEVQQTKPVLVMTEAFSRLLEKRDAALRFEFPKMGTIHLSNSRLVSITLRFGKPITISPTRTVLYFSIFGRKTKVRC